jgi:hypothetical protein
MSSKNASEPSKSPAELSPRMVLWISLGAMLVAAAPHFFLATPLEFYGEGNLRGWLGLSIWSPTFLGAVALFCGVDVSARSATPLLKSSNWRSVAGICAPIIVLVIQCYLYFDGYQRVGDWSELGRAMAIYAGIFAVGGLFWQGFVQDRLLADLRAGSWTQILLAVALALVGCALWLPFLANHPFSAISATLSGFLVIYLAVALLFEFGLSLFACMAAAALMGAAWAWAHQMTFF